MIQESQPRRNRNDRKSRMKMLKGIVKQISEKGDHADREKLVAIMGCDWGLSRRTSLEYLKQLIVAEYFIEDSHGLSWNYER